MKVWFAVSEEVKDAYACSSEKEAVAEAKKRTMEAAQTTTVEIWTFPDMAKKDVLINLYRGLIKIEKKKKHRFMPSGRKKRDGTWSAIKVAVDL